MTDRGNTRIDGLPIGLVGVLEQTNQIDGRLLPRQQGGSVRWTWTLRDGHNVTRQVAMLRHRQMIEAVFLATSATARLTASGAAWLNRNKERPNGRQTEDAASACDQGSGAVHRPRASPAEGAGRRAGCQSSDPQRAGEAGKPGSDAVARRLPATAKVLRSKIEFNTREQVRRVAAALKIAREARKLSQRDISRAIGSRVDTIARWENGRELIPFTRMIEYAAALDVPLWQVVRAATNQTEGNSS